MTAAEAIAMLVFALVMAFARAVSERPARSPRSDRSWSAPDPRDARVLLAIGLVLSVMVVGVPFVALVATMVLGGWVGLCRRGRRIRQRAIDRAIPELVDLFVLAASVGHPVWRSLELVSTRAPAAVRPMVVAACAQVERGAPLASALEQFGRILGPLGCTLTDALVSGLVTGSPLGPALAGVAEAAHDRRRRQAEEAAKRLPITLLVPLVCCILPAFILLAVVPLLVGSFASLQT